MQKRIESVMKSFNNACKRQGVAPRFVINFPTQKIPWLGRLGVKLLARYKAKIDIQFVDLKKS